MSVKIYIRDKHDGTVREYGTDKHDSLILNDDGSLRYQNIQNLDGTGKRGGYEFCLRGGSIPTEDTDEEFGIDRYLDIGGEHTGIDCGFCKNRGNIRRCGCCKRFSKDEDNYERDDKKYNEFVEMIGLYCDDESEER